MPFTGSTFTLPVGATTAVAGNIVQSATWNAIHSDLNTGLTMLMSQLVSDISLRNILLDNGGFEIWQRGAGSSASIAVVASTTVYTADRWYLAAGANEASVVSAVAGLSNGSNLAAKVLKNAGQTGTTPYTFGYPLDNIEIAVLHGNKLSLSCLVKAGANWSPTNGTLNVAFYTGTGSPAKRGAGFTGETQVFTSSINLTVGGSAVALAVTSTVIVPVNTTQAELQFTWTPVGTAGADDSVTIDDVQVESNLSATTWTPTNFDRAPFRISLVGCKRHYKKTFPYSVAPAQNGGLPGAVVVVTNAASKFGYAWNFGDIELRATGAVTTYNPLGASANWQDISGAASLNATVDTTSASNCSKMIFVGGATAAATDRQIMIHITADAGI